MTIHHYFTGGVLFRGICRITGRPISEVSRCSMAHARASLVKQYPTLADAAIISEMRYNSAQRIRRKRAELRAARIDVEAAIDAGYFPSISQLRKAQLLTP